eukprot:Phypoly_transcript_03187.p1 GENE.Phypoly_transcript_03187~~Phypoly_transcript_03187.p1  ORF type:complete len:717 (+),score=118.81 Phypoly_transcript_03187:138-2288(+)
MTDVRRIVDPRRVGTATEAKENPVVAKKTMEEEPEPQVIIEERISKPEGEYIKKYLRGKFLGKGGFAKCYEVRDLTTNQIYAAKVVAKNTLTKSRAKQKLTAEIKIHRSLHHTHIVKFEHFFEDHENVYILLEMCNQKSMMELIRRRGTLTEMEARYYLLQVISATKYMHSCRVIHRDLKLGNLFLNNMQIKIGDFGLAAKLDHDGQRKKTICGTPNYIAPEILEGTNGHSYEVDIWSLGVILYTLIIGKPPFETKDVKSTYKRIKANMYSFPDSVPISECAKSLIRRILHTVPEARPNIDEMLQHPFFSGGYTVPKLLSSSALYQPPSPVKSPNKSSPYRLTGSPSRVPLSERTNNTNTNMGIPTTFKEGLPSSNVLTSNFPASSTNPTVGSQRQSFQTQSPATTPENEELDNSHTRKMRKIDKVKENVDLRTLFLKSRLADGPESSAPQTVPAPSTFSTAVSVQAQQAYPPQNTPLYPESGEEDDQLNVFHQNLVESFLVKGVVDRAHQTTLQHPSIWVVKWVDYSNKYGLGYQLSNNIFGAYFNDATKLVVGGNAKQCEYIDQTRSETGSDRKVYLMDPPTPHPHQLNKKITLLKYFKNYLVEQSNKSEELPTLPPSSNLIYVKKWLRTKLAIIFRLSNKIVQVNFFDHTKIILSSEATVITYITPPPNKQTITQSLSVIVQDPPSDDLIERLKYIRDILHHMIDHKKSTKTK